MSDKEPSTVEPPETKVQSVVDILFDVYKPIKESGRAAHTVARLEALEQIQSREQQDPDTPWLINGEDSQSTCQRKNLERKVMLSQRTVVLAGRMQAAFAMVEMLEQIDTSQDIDGYLDEDGTYHDLQEIFSDVMPDDAKHGRSRAMLRFLYDTSHGQATVKILLQAGILKERIALCHIPGKASLLGELSRMVNRVVDLFPDSQDQLDKFNWLIDQAHGCKSINEFVQNTEQEIPDPRHPRPDPLLYSTNEDGDQVRATIEMTRDQYIKVFLARLQNRLQESSVNLSASLSAEMVIEAQQGDLTRIKRAYAFSSPARAACLGMVENNDLVTVDMVLTATQNIGAPLKEKQITHAFSELESVSLVRRVWKNGEGWIQC